MDFKNINYDEVQALFVSPHYKQIVSPYRIKRVQKGNQRYYCTITDNKPQFYMSVTSFAGASLNNQYLSKWRGKLGNDLADYTAHVAAKYGTLMHILIGDFLKSTKINLDTLDDYVCDYMLDERIDLRLSTEWIDKMHNDILSFAQFCIDKNIEPIAIEFPLISDSTGLGGCIDLVCKMDFNKKRINAIVDFKSGRKGFFESHELQLLCYQDMWNEHYQDIMPVSHVFNWAPKDWRTKPTYKLQNQTDSTIAHKHLIARALAEGWSKNPAPLKRGKGVLEFGQETIEHNINIIELSDYMKMKNKIK